jgi:hypothetical protein
MALAIDMGFGVVGGDCDLCRMSAGLPDKHEQIGHTSTVWPERNSGERSEGQLMGFWLRHDVCYEMGQVERTLAVYYSVI